eukprot:1272458-Pleurochrysis_carterae.AAC.1
MWAPIVGWASRPMLLTEFYSLQAAALTSVSQLMKAFSTSHLEPDRHTCRFVAALERPPASVQAK